MGRKLASKVFNAKDGQLQSDNVQFVLQDSARRVWIGTDKGLYCWKDNVLQCADKSHSFQRACSFKGKTCFITVDGEIGMAHKEGRLSLAAKLPDVLARIGLAG